MLAFDRQEHLIQVLFVTESGTATPELIGIRLTKFAAPLPHRLIGHGHPTFQQELFDIPEAQTESKVQPHGVADDLNGKTIVLIASG
jgi:hypothetical protein